MTLKNQWNTIKENWIIAVILLLVLVVPLFSGSNISSLKTSSYGMPMMESAEMAIARDYGGNDFAPEIESRIITKTASLTTEIKRGQFHNTDAKIKVIVTGTDSILLNENTNKHGKGTSSYYSGSYQIKVPTSKYSLALDQFKALGEV